MSLPQKPATLASKSEWIAYHLAVIAILKASGGL